MLPFKQVSVSSPVLQDIVKDIPVEEGDSVKVGQVLAHLMNDREELEVKRCENLIQRADFESKGMQKLADEKLASKDAALEKQTDLQAAKIQYQLAQTALDEKTIRSPLAGIVVKRYKEPGESVDRTEKLFDIVNIDRVYVQFYLAAKADRENRGQGQDRGALSHAGERQPVLRGGRFHLSIRASMPGAGSSG